MSQSVIAEPRSDDLKVPPHNIEAEQYVIGGLLISNESWDEISDQITSDDFYRFDHRLFFESITGLADEDKPFDAVTIADWLKGRGQLRNEEWREYLIALDKNTPSAANIRHYTKTVREASMLRNLITVSNKTTALAVHNEGLAVDEVLNRAEQLIYQVSDQEVKRKSGYETVRVLVDRASKRIEELSRSGAGEVTGIATGFDDFDRLTTGLHDSDLIILAGRPAMGKTSFAMNIVENAAVKEGKSVAVFSMEMSSEQLTTRLISSLGRIDSGKIRIGDLDEQDWSYLNKSIEVLADAKIHIDDTPGLTPSEMRSRIRRLDRQYGVDLVVIDYLQLMQGDKTGSLENRTAEVSGISRSLKAMAKEMNVPVIALSQLNRSVETRSNKRPMVSDLRESGSLEQDADIVLFIYRDEYYNPDHPGNKGVAEIIIGKQRHGAIGTVNVAFQGVYTRFDNLVDNNRYAPAEIEEKSNRNQFRRNVR